jgi:hypothetical protein
MLLVRERINFSRTIMTNKLVERFETLEIFSEGGKNQTTSLVRLGDTTLIRVQLTWTSVLEALENGSV